MPTYLRHTDFIPASVKAVDGQHQLVQPGETVQTWLVLDAQPGWTKISDEPYLQLAAAVHEVTFGGAETIMVPADGTLLAANMLRIITGVKLTATPNVAANPYGYPLDPALEPKVDIRNDGTIDTLYLTSTGAGTAIVIELEVEK